MKAQPNSPKGPLLPACRKCHTSIAWGDVACAQCGTKVLRGLPRIIDAPLGSVVHLFAVLVLFLIVSAACRLVDLEVPILVRLVIAALVVVCKLGITPDIAVLPQTAHLAVLLREGRLEQRDGEEQPFELTVAAPDWRDRSKGGLDAEFVLGKLEEEDKARLLAYLPPSSVPRRRKHLLELSRADSPTVRTLALRAMARIPSPRSLDRMRQMLMDNELDDEVRGVARQVVDRMEQRREEREAPAGDAQS